MPQGVSIRKPPFCELPCFFLPPGSVVYPPRPPGRIMSASQSPELSDIQCHTAGGGGPSTVAETLQVSTEPATISIGTTPLSAAVVSSESHAVGASISVPPETSGSVERSSTALLNLASNSLSLTEILNAQQQALEQFQCQLQLAQQTEAINQRLDAIERTLNSLIQQKAQEDAEKKAQQEQAEQQAAVAAAHRQQQEQQVDRLTVREHCCFHYQSRTPIGQKSVHIQCFPRIKKKGEGGFITLKLFTPGHIHC